MNKKRHSIISNDNIQAAILNILEDFKYDANDVAQSRKAVLNVLKDLEVSNSELQETVKRLEESEKKLAVSLLSTQQQNAQNKAILACIGDGLVVTNKLGNITYVNTAFEKLTGWKTEEVLGEKIATILPVENEPQAHSPFASEIFDQVLSGKSYSSGIGNVFYNIRKDKSSFPASSIITPIRLNGEVVGLVKTFHDITKEKDIDKAKTEFVSLASHQLRTPLSAINWYTEMLLSGDVGEVNPEQEKYLQEVYKGNQRMITLVNALLNVSRMSLGTFILEPEKTDIALLVRNVANEQRPEIDKKDILFSYSPDAKIPYIQTDQKLMRMVVENLLSNAIKYTQASGSIALKLGLNDDKSKLLLTVTDTGYGIPENQQPQIFDKLFRADNVREKDTEGTGLGLYIVKAIVDNSGGSVWFTSTENVGTTFYVELPIAMS